MTDNEITCWIRSLAPTNTARAAIIRDLLIHKAEDQMSSEDAKVCRLGLELVKEGVVPEEKEIDWEMRWRGILERLREADFSQF